MASVRKQFIHVPARTLKIMKGRMELTKVNFVGEGPLTSEVSKVTLVRNWDEARGTPRGRGRQQLERRRYR